MTLWVCSTCAWWLRRTPLLERNADPWYRQLLTNSVIGPRPRPRRMRKIPRRLGVHTITYLPGREWVCSCRAKGRGYHSKMRHRQKVRARGGTTPR